jgi:hypothetical protein
LCIGMNTAANLPALVCLPGLRSTSQGRRQRLNMMERTVEQQE